MTQPTAHPKNGPAERVAAVADRLFYENGYSATGINQIIAEANVAKASFYQHFPSKIDLALAYLDRRGREWFGELQAEVNRHRSPQREVLALFDFLLQWMPASGFRGCPFLNIAAEFPEHESAVRDHVRQTKQATRDYVNELVTRAGCPQAGDQVFLLFESAVVEAQVFVDVWPIRAARKSVEALLKKPQT